MRTMRRLLLLSLLLVAGCSKGPQADLQYISTARSLAAEWALVNQMAAQGKLTDAYVSGMRTSLQQQARVAATALTQPNSSYGRQMQALATEPGDAAPAQLRARSDALKHTEDSLESA
jgi:Tfp pilus assembly protein PilP